MLHTTLLHILEESLEDVLFVLFLLEKSSSQLLHIGHLAFSQFLVKYTFESVYSVNSAS